MLVEWKVMYVKVIIIAQKTQYEINVRRHMSIRLLSVRETGYQAL